MYVTKKEFYGAISSIFVFIWSALVVSNSNSDSKNSYTLIFIMAIAMQLYYTFKLLKAKNEEDEVNSLNQEETL